jgi:L-fuconolactonase
MNEPRFGESAQQLARPRDAADDRARGYPLTVVDAHHHVWRLGRHDYFWLTPDLAIHRDYGLDDMRPVLGDIAATVLVQASPTRAETNFLIDVAAASDGLVRAVVGWVDLADGAAPDAIAELAQRPFVKGVRPMLGFIDDTYWILRPEIQPGLSALAAHGLRLDVPARARHLQLLPELAQRHPSLPIVIDHGAKPAIARGEFEPWAREIACVARTTSFFCKLSGLANEARADWQDADLQPYVDHLLECFGPDRLMWGSDWPVVELAGGLGRWLDVTRRLLPADAEAAVLRDTAVAFYGLDRADNPPPHR